MATSEAQEGPIPFTQLAGEQDLPITSANPSELVAPPLPTGGPGSEQSLLHLQTTESHETPTISTDVGTLLSFNEYFRMGAEEPPNRKCIRCQRPKNQKINSHIIPRSLLDEFRKIHCHNLENFMYDISGDVQKTKDLTYPLLCQKCEKNIYLMCPACLKPNCRKPINHEEKLRNVYLLLLSKGEITVVNSKQDFNEHTDNLKCQNRWFSRILAEIMLRGVFVSKTFTTILKSYKPDFEALWRFACGLQNECTIKLFLLPDGPVSQTGGFRDFLFPLELILRAPHLTELYQSEDNGAFLYTQFDCFHLVLPLDDKSQIYFLPKIDLSQDNISLDRSQYPSDYITLEDSQYFPGALLRINKERYPRYASGLLNHENQQHTFIDSAETVPEEPARNSSVVLKMIVDTGIKKAQTTASVKKTKLKYDPTTKGKPEEVHYWMGTDKKSSVYKTLQKAATSRSLLAKHIQSKLLMEKIDQLQEDYKKQKEDNAEQKQEIEQLLIQKGELKGVVTSRIKQLEKQEAKLEHEITKLRKENEQLRMEYGQLRERERSLIAQTEQLEQHKRENQTEIRELREEKNLLQVEYREQRQREKLLEEKVEQVKQQIEDTENHTSKSLAEIKTMIKREKSSKAEIEKKIKLAAKRRIEQKEWKHFFVITFLTFFSLVIIHVCFFFQIIELNII